MVDISARLLFLLQLQLLAVSKALTL